MDDRSARDQPLAGGVLGGGVVGGGECVGGGVMVEAEGLGEVVVGVGDGDFDGDDEGLGDFDGPGLRDEDEWPGAGEGGRE
jgi:hypothetical protein